MLIDREDLLDLLGLRVEAMAPGVVQRYAGRGTDRRAVVAWSKDGGFLAEVSEEVPGDEDRRMVALQGSYDPDEDAFLLEGEDLTGETSDGNDPRAAAALWRRLVRFMEPTE